MKMRKRLILTLGAVVVLGVLVAVYFGNRQKPVQINSTTPTSSSNQASEQKVYFNKFFDFSFWYPPEITVFDPVKEYPEGGDISSLVLQTGENFGYNDVHIEISKLDVPGSLADWLEHSVKQNNGQFPAITNLKNFQTKFLTNGVSYFKRMNENEGTYNLTFYNSVHKYTLTLSRSTVRLSKPPIVEDPIIMGIVNSINFLDNRVPTRWWPGVVVFDNCGKIDKYVHLSWYRAFQKLLIEIGIPEKIISEACLSLDGSMLIFLTSGRYMGEPKVFRYNTVNGDLQLATIKNKTKGFLATPGGFGKREGTIIHMLPGTTGDAGHGSTMYFDYNYNENVLELKKSYDFSQLEGEWRYY